MAEKKPQYKKYVEGIRESRKPQKEPGGPIVIGKALSPQEISEMLADLRSKERERSIAGAIKFFEGSESVKTEASKDPNIDIKSITESAINILKADTDVILSVMEETKKMAALSFLSRSEYVPEPVKAKAEAGLKRLHIQEDSEKFELKKEKEMEVKAFMPQQVNALWKELNGPDKQAQIKAAIALFTFYPKISEAMPKIPDLTISQLMARAKDISNQNTDPLFRMLIKTLNRAALGFLATNRTMPPKIQERASAALKAMGEAPKITAPIVQVGPSKQEEKVRIGKSEIQVKKPEQEPRKFDIPKVKRLDLDLRSKDHDRSIIAAISVFSNYQEISQVVSKIPLLTISQLKDKACNIASRHSSDFFQRIVQENNMKTLEFIAKSEVIPLNLRKKAQDVIDYMLQPKARDKGRIVPRVIMDEGGAPDDGG